MLLLRPFGIPSMTPQALGLFRLVLGLGFLFLLLDYQPIRAFPPEVFRPRSPLADMAWVTALATSERATAVLQTAGLASAALFAAGVFARPAYVVFVGILTVHVLMIVARRSAHDWGLPLVTLLALLIVPWGEAPGLLHFLRRRPAATGASRVYGFAIWLPALTLGLAYAAAAYAKLRRSGLEWITNGAVRYHFVEDGRETPLPLGLWVATHVDVAIALSLAAVVVEAVFVLVVFTARWQARALFGLMAVMLMAGFYVFQNVVWWPWWLLLTAFLPWSLIGGPAASRPTADRLSWRHAALVAVLVITQLWASYRAIEIEPLISNFPMYSHTYASPSDFERRQVRARFEWEGQDISDRVDAAGGFGLLRRIADPTVDPQEAAEDEERLVRFLSRYEQLYGSVPPAVEVVLVKRPFDWERGRYLPESEERIRVELAP